MTKHAITRVRHEARRRLLTVQTVQRLTPNMVRVTLGGDLAGFVSSSYDDHVKVFFPLPGQSAPTVPEQDAGPWLLPAKAKLLRRIPRCLDQAGASRRRKTSPPPRPKPSFLPGPGHSSPDERGCIPSISSSSSGSSTGEEMR